MPYKVKRSSGKYCVYKYPSKAARDSDENGERIPSGCHDSRSEAISHMQAIQISEAKDFIKSELSKFGAKSSS